MPPDSAAGGRSALTEEEAEALLDGICFKTGPPRTVGVELEWLVHDRHHPEQCISDARRTAAYDRLSALPLKSALTFEPGGQLELSSPPSASLTECIRTVTADLDAVRSLLGTSGLVLAGYGQDPWHHHDRMLHAPRYDAMEAYFDRLGDTGRTMMRTTASVQVCLDAGQEEPGPLGHGRRWQLAHLLGAVLVAAFANSPMRRGRPTGWRSTRQAVWTKLDPPRTAAPTAQGDPRSAWTAHVLDAPVMCVRAEDGPWDVPDGLTFRDWIRHGLPRPPDRSDLEYHMTTLFPPVRPRGHLELRMIDAQPGSDGWIVPLAVTTALFDDPQAAETVYRTVKPLAETAGRLPAPRNLLWQNAARHGMADPELRTTAAACFETALEALPRIGAGRAVQDAVADYAERYVLRGRCPADDVLAPEPEKDLRT